MKKIVLLASMIMIAVCGCSKDASVEPVIILKEANVTLMPLSTKMLEVVVENQTNPPYTVVWETSNSQVVRVDNGVLEAYKVGEADVKAYLYDKPSVYAICKVTVASDGKVSVVTIDKKTLAMEVGEIQQLTATVEPSDAKNKKVTWVSSNPSVVSVDDTGKVKAVSKGMVTITVITEEGRHTDTCGVVVS